MVPPDQLQKFKSIDLQDLIKEDFKKQEFFEKHGSNENEGCTNVTWNTLTKNYNFDENKYLITQLKIYDIYSNKINSTVRNFDHNKFKIGSKF